MVTSAPVVVVAGGDTDLPIARTLGRLGVPLYLIAPKGKRGPASSSRYWASKREWDFSLAEEESVAYLCDVAAALRAAHGARPILLTSSDWGAVFIERNRYSLWDQFVFPRPRLPLIRTLVD